MIIIECLRIACFSRGVKAKKEKNLKGEGKRFEPANSLKSSEILKVPK
jgi:hypothetical protein